MRFGCSDSQCFQAPLNEFCAIEFVSDVLVQAALAYAFLALADRGGREDDRLPSQSPRLLAEAGE